MVLKVLDHYLKQSGGKVRWKHATLFLKFFQQCKQGDIILGIQVLHSEDLNHEAGKPMSDEQLFRILDIVELLHEFDGLNSTTGTIFMVLSVRK